jgi:hypothetical protein
LEHRFSKVLRSLEARNLRTFYAGNIETARKVVLEIIPENAVVGIGDSSTVRQIGIIEELERRPTRVINPFDMRRPITDERSYEQLLFRPLLAATLSDVFLTGANAITEDGRIVSVDGAGNRVAGTFWGHPTVVLLVGRNKIAKDMNEAFDRLKTVIVPEHMRRRKIFSSPCTEIGRCVDCYGKDRACVVTAIIEGKPLFTDINVVLVDEDLGLAWSRDWPEDRIQSIAENHERHMWTLPREIEQRIDKKALWKKAMPSVSLQG